MNEKRRNLRIHGVSFFHYFVSIIIATNLTVNRILRYYGGMAKDDRTVNLCKKERGAKEWQKHCLR